jgi:flagellar motility protein MotE (MotC chaperone)
LRERQEALVRAEQQLKTRKRELDLIRDDIRSERDDIDEVRKELSDQVKGAAADMAAVERRAIQAEEKRRETDELVKDAKRTISEVDGVRSGNVKRVGGILDTAEPAEAARIVETMVESGDLMTAVQILANMKDRKAAAVLSAMTDKTMAAQLMEKMIGLRQSSAAPAAPGASRARAATPPDSN